MSSRRWFWSAVLLLVIAGTLSAQDPPEDTSPPTPPSPLDLVRGLREAGMSDLAMEYLREIEGKRLSDDDRKAILLERARCLLDAADNEPDEGTRASMIGEAKEWFNEFLIKNPKHPRASEAALAVARLTSIEARAQLNRALRMDVPPPSEGPDKADREREREAALNKQRDEAKKAQELFKLASTRFAQGAEQLKTRLDDESLASAVRQRLARESFDAELAAAINQYHLAETVLAANASATQQRVAFLEEAQKGFAKLADEPPTSRSGWIARAWMGETLLEQSKPNDAKAVFDKILNSTYAEADEGKRLVQFFQSRRGYVNAVAMRSQDALRRAATDLRAWLARYGNARRPSPETLAARYYLAYSLQLQAELSIGTPPRDKPQPEVTGTARTLLAEAEKICRTLAQTDNDYTTRATRNRMSIVRKLLGEVDHPLSSYTTFENAQMAALIQIAKLQDAERAVSVAEAKKAALVRAGGGKPFAMMVAELQRQRAIDEIPERKVRILALLERARELATPADNPTDVTDNLLRLVYFYQTADQPYQAAVLGEHIARTIRSTGGKSSLAGLMALNGYMNAAANLKVSTDDPTLQAEAEAAFAAMRKTDRERAVALAQFLDKQFPNDPATDGVRHRLAVLLAQDEKFDQAFDMVTRVRAGYAQLTAARQLEGYVAFQLITTQARDLPLPAGGKVAVYARATDDLARVVKPLITAPEDDVRGYVSVRARLGQLYLAQSRTDEQREKTTPGYDRALAEANEIIAMVPTFECLKTNPVDNGLNLDGLELRLLGEDLRTRALFLRGRALVDAGKEKLPAAALAIKPITDDVVKTGSLMTEKMNQWRGGQGDADDTSDTARQKQRIAELTAGVDKARRDIVMLGFKLQVKQGKPADAAVMLELLKRAGGSVADNQATYELMARELAAPIPGLRREKRTDEAKALGDGLALLLKELAGVPNRSTASTLFIGQALHTVDQHEDALKEFAKIPVPVVPKDDHIAAGTAWWQVDPKVIDDGQARTKFQTEVRDYRFAQLYTAKALAGAKKLDEAEKMLTGIIGTSEKQGWGYASYDFRRELALVYEARGASIADVKAAGAEWGKANKEWTTLFQFASARLRNLPADASPAQIRQAKSAFFDAFYEVQRLLVAANAQLLRGNPKLNDTFTSIGKKIAEMEITNKIEEQEKKGEGIMTPEVWNRFHELLEAHPPVKAAYKAAGGKIFLERARE